VVANKLRVLLSGGGGILFRRNAKAESRRLVTREVAGDRLGSGARIFGDLDNSLNAGSFENFDNLLKRPSVM
jgi:hypothetical protein